MQATSIPAEKSPPKSKGGARAPSARAAVPRASSRPSRKLLLTSDPSDASSAYGRLAAQLHSARHTRPLTTLMIASAMPDEGKSLTTANLGLTLSGPCGKRVLLVDADLRRPSLHSLFGVPNTTGLGDCLLSPADTPLRPIALSDNLFLVTAGQADRDPLTMLTSNGLPAFLAQQSQRFDWVLVDAPPLAVFPDAHLVASAADGVLLVVRAGRTPLAAVQTTVRMLGRERILGIVLNRAATSSPPYYAQDARRSTQG